MKQTVGPLQLLLILAWPSLSPHRVQGAPKFQAPWWPLRIALDRALFLHVLVMLVGYGTYICSLAVLPFYLSRPPYALSTGGIGAVYIPGAVAAILASPCGGKLADWAARANPQQPLRRVLYANLLGLLTPLSFIMLGWGLQKGLPLAVPLVAGFVASFINSLYMPALFTVRMCVCAGLVVLAHMLTRVSCMLALRSLCPMP